jgi:SAM-dependent methyltransferase
VKAVFEDIERYYAACIRRHGPTPAGVDWKDEPSQTLRFDKLAQLLPRTTHFSVTDIGCGYGAFYDHLRAMEFHGFGYIGTDLSSDMLSHARTLHQNTDNAHFARDDGMTDLPESDYVVASGIFNVRMEHSHDVWEDYIMYTIDRMDRASRHGMAFNMLTSYSDPEYQRQDLYYGDPKRFFDYCKQRISRHVSLLHDYGLYEFTMIVRKTI